MDIRHPSLANVKFLWETAQFHRSGFAGVSNGYKITCLEHFAISHRLRCPIAAYSLRRIPRIALRKIPRILCAEFCVFVALNPNRKNVKIALMYKKTFVRQKLSRSRFSTYIICGDIKPNNCFTWKIVHLVVSRECSNIYEN